MAGGVASLAGWCRGGAAGVGRNRGGSEGRAGQENIEEGRIK